jgi:hypothetical protein
MNEIRVKPLLLAGLGTFLAWIFAEILVEQVIGRILFGNLIEELWLQTTIVSEWGALNHVLNIFIALLNSTLMIWLYASLRPMYGVGTRTALITWALGTIWVWSLTINLINLGFFPPMAGLVEAVYESIEFMIAMIVGAAVYEQEGEKIRETE